ncbi:MAG: BNR-4 repeat-containing protein [Bacteroidales bacterium]|nr:BNR-4 repeat-containing protein [Bacteroidales bacterium]
MILRYYLVIISLIPFTVFAQNIIEGGCIPGEDHLTLTSDGAWCWFSDPRAILYKGNHNRIYAGWMNSSGDVVAGFYDCDDNGIISDTIHRKLEIDDHDNPSLFIGQAGKPIFYYSGHAQKSPIYARKSKTPEYIGEWENEKLLYLNDTISYNNLSNSYTYTNIIQLSQENNRMYLFWRGMDFKPNFSVSDDGGTSWSAGEILILPDRLYRDRRPYVKFGSDGKEKIHIAFTDGHPRDEPTNSIYYLCYRNDTLFKAGGTMIGSLSDVPVKPEQADLVYNANLTGEKAWIWDVAEDKDGNPVIVYTRFPDDSNHCYYYAIWNGTGWENHFMVNSGGWFPQTPPGKAEPEPNYSGGLVLDHEDPSVVYLSVKRNKVFEIEKWTTHDRGLTWSVDEITCHSKNDNVRPFAIRHADKNDRIQVIWMNVNRYVHYTNYHSSLKMK